MNTDSKHNCLDIDELLIRTKGNIEEFGLQVIMVSSTEYSPSFAYSIGLWERYNHPEIICFGFSNDLGHAIINDVARIIKSGDKILIDKTYSEIFEESKATFLKVDERNIDDYFKVARRYYNNNHFESLQLIWTDRNDKFPWEENFEDELIYIQPLLDRNADFKFREPKNLTTFTTRQWLEEGKPILYVAHDNDGDWQFLTNDQMPEDIRVVALEQLVLKDATLNEVFDLEYGESAERKFVGGKWSITQMENNDEEE